MPSYKWSKLNHLQLGRYAEYYVKMEFSSYGFEVYTSEVDDHGVDFVVKYKNSGFYEVQVKAVRQNNYMYIPKEKMPLSDHFLVCYLRFHDDVPPECYVFRSTVWENPNGLFVYRPYENTKSKPEYGISYNKKNAPLLEPHRADLFFEQFLGENDKED